MKHVRSLYSAVRKDRAKNSIFILKIKIALKSDNFCVFFLLFLITKLQSVMISFESKLHHCGSSSAIPNESSCSMLLTRALLCSAVSVQKMAQLSADGIGNSPTVCLRNYPTKRHQNGIVFFHQFSVEGFEI